MYISGPPGSGKTATVTSLLSSWRRRKIKPVIVQLNCVNFSKKPSSIFEELYFLLMKNNSRTKLDDITILKNLRNKISRTEVPIIVIIDEIDQLIDKDTEVVYQLFELTRIDKANLIIISIANALDMTKRSLPRLGSNSVEPELVHFAPYTSSQLEVILLSKISSLPVQVFELKTIKFVSVKVASMKGDIRLAFNICKKAADILDEQYGSEWLYNISEPIEQITLEMASTIFSSLDNSILTIQNLPLHQQIILSCIAYLSKNNKTVYFEKLKTFANSQTRKLKLEQIQKEIFDLCNFLKEAGIIDIKEKKNNNNIIRLSISYDDVEFSLQDNPFCKSILNG